MVMLELAKSDHRNFVGKISSCLKGELPMEASKLPDHHTCRFGKWYDSAGSDLCGSSPSFREISSPHEKIHELSKQAVDAYNSGNKQRAAQVYEEVVRVSAQIIPLVDRNKEDCEKT